MAQRARARSRAARRAQGRPATRARRGRPRARRRRPGRDGGRRPCRAIACAADAGLAGRRAPPCRRWLRRGARSSAADPAAAGMVDRTEGVRPRPSAEMSAASRVDAVQGPRRRRASARSRGVGLMPDSASADSRSAHEPGAELGILLGAARPGRRGSACRRGSSCAASTQPTGAGGKSGEQPCQLFDRLVRSNHPSTGRSSGPGSSNASFSFSRQREMRLAIVPAGRSRASPIVR